VTGIFPIDLIKGYHPSQQLLEAEEAIQSGRQTKFEKGVVEF